MSFFISDAMAQAAGGGSADMLTSFAPLILIFIVFYFLLIRPQSKRQKEHKQMIAELGKGDEVVTSGGLYGKVTDLGDSFVQLEVAEGVEVKVQRHAVTATLPKGSGKSL